MHLDALLGCLQRIRPEDLMPLQLSPRLYGNVYVIQCTGSLVLGDEVRALETAIGQATHQSIYLVLNLGSIERIDSIGLGLLVRSCTGLGKRGGDLRLAAAPPLVVALLRRTSLTKLFKLFPTEEDAIASFRRLGSVPKLPTARGTRLLVFDPSPHLCVFLRSVLSCRGFEVRSATNLQEAGLLLDAQSVEVLLIGPGTAQLSPDVAAATLAPSSPGATVLQLPPDFKSLDAAQATEALLGLFAPEKAASIRQPNRISVVE